MTNKEVFLTLMSNLDCLSYEDKLYLRGYLDGIYCTNPFLIKLINRITKLRIKQNA